MRMTSRSQSQTRDTRSPSLDGSVYTVSSISSIPSIQVLQSVGSIAINDNFQDIPLEVEIDAREYGYGQEEEDEHQSATVSVEHERQVLLLFLLAQVCALHDPTPRTFTVHVLGLFEQGILDREAIQFLFELGFVPSSTVDSRDLLTKTGTSGAIVATCAPINAINTGRSSNTPIPTENNPSNDDLEYYIHQTKSTSRTRKLEFATATELAVASNTNILHSVKSAIPGVTTLHSKQTLRSLEATAIRKQLSQHDDMNYNSIRKKSNPVGIVTAEQSSPLANDTKNRKITWDVANFPLSMSRYQREFKEIALLSSGSFGSVFRAVRELDGCEYAVKKVTFDAMGYSDESIGQVIREVQCLAAVDDHPNIVRYYTSWWEPTWMTGSIPRKSCRTSESGTNTMHRKFLGNGSNTNSAPSRSRETNREKFCKRVLWIGEKSAGEESHRRFDNATEDCSVSLSSSSSWSSDSNDDYYSLDGGFMSSGNSLWRNYQIHDAQLFSGVNDDSYMTKTAYRRRKRSTHKIKKNAATLNPYQYQISLYIQMQLCHPANLHDWMRERNMQIPESDHDRRIGPAVEIFQQICSGLAHIHKSNVIHRDLKPTNIFVSSDGKTIKIGDFGLSKQLRGIKSHQHTVASSTEPSSSHQHPPGKKSLKISNTQISNDVLVPMSTGTSSLQVIVEYHKVGDNLTSGIGTASYAAPEQVQSKTYGTAVDIFSLGLIFLELISCFETEHERLHNLQQCRYQRLPKWVESNYQEISSTILACTSPNACDRPTAKELVDAAKIKSPRSWKEVHMLERQLAEKNEKIAEKNETIKNMHVELERLRSLLVRQKGHEHDFVGYQGEGVFSQDVLIFNDGIEYE